MKRHSQAGTVLDWTDQARRDIEAIGQDPDEVLNGAHIFAMWCGGCPYFVPKFSISSEMLEDSAFSGTGWVRALGWQADPLRCPYCTGAEKRPEGNHAAPYEEVP